MNWIEELKCYTPQDDREKADRASALFASEQLGDISTRDNPLIHLTASAFIVNSTRDKTLMIYHNIYDSWSWTGGHADGEENLLCTAVREAKEETGIEKLKPLFPSMVSFDILTVKGHIKNGQHVSAHLHANAAYLFEADDTQPVFPKPDENSAAGWLPIRLLSKYVTEKEMLFYYEKLIRRIPRTDCSQTS